jgi:hypothetical protein
MARLMRPIASPRALAALGLVLLAACPATGGRGSSDKPAGLGKPLVTGLAKHLAPSPDGTALAFLDDCEHPKDKRIPDDIFVCNLELISADGGSPHRVAKGVTSLEVGFQWSADGRALAVLGEWDHAKNSGALYLATREAAPRKLADDVTFYAFDRGSKRLGFVSGGHLQIAAVPVGEGKAVLGPSDVATFEFGPQATDAPLLARQSGTKGGDLWLVSGSGEARKLTEHSAEYGFSPDGGRVAWTARKDPRGGSNDLFETATDKLVPTALGEGVQGFAWSKDASTIAFVAGVSKDKTIGDLWVAKHGEKAEKLAEKVGEYRWAAGAQRLGWIEQFNSQTRSGTVAVGGLGVKPVKFGPHVSNFSLAPDAKRIAYLQRVTAGTFSVDLMLAQAEEGAKAVLVARGGFGFDFSPDAQQLFYRTACVRNGEACELFTIPAAGLPEGAQPKQIAQAIKSFEFLDRSDRLLVTWARKDMVALDVAVYENGKLTAVDNAVLPGSAVMLKPDLRRAAYLVIDRKRPGVYLAKLPEPVAAPAPAPGK